MPTKKYDLAVKVGSYEKDGQSKNRYQNVGAVMQGDNGPFLLLNKTFNPAGVPGDPDRDNLIISCFEPRDQGGNSAPTEKPKQDSKPADDYDDDIPF